MKLKEKIDKNTSQEIQHLILQAKRDLEEIFDSVHEAITIHDANFNIIRANKSAESLLGLPIQKILSQKCFLIYHKTVCPPESCPGCKTLKSGITATTELYEPKLNKYLEITAIPRFNIDQEIIGIIHIVRDITHQKHLKEELLSMSLTDELTGLYNRRGYSTLAAQYLKVINRQKKGVYILYADLDNMKWINDNFGHQEGDIALIETANILKDNYRESDIIARIGGDEFVILPIGTHRDTIEKISFRLHKTLEHYNELNKRSYKISISSGIAYYDLEHPCSIDELLHKADKLMYQQKKQKKIFR